MYLHETRLAMLIDADAVPVAHRRPYRDIDIRYPWRSDEQRAADVEIVPEKKTALEIINQAPLLTKIDISDDVPLEKFLMRHRMIEDDFVIRPPQVIIEGPSSPPDFHINAELLRVAEDGFSSQQAKLAAERLARIAESLRTAKNGRFSALDDGDIDLSRSTVYR